MKTWIFLVIGVVLAVAVSAFVIAGSPSKERARRFDDLRVQHLQSIQARVIGHWQAKRTLPAVLAETSVGVGDIALPKDPATGAAYDYQKTSDTTFRICAQFTEPSRDRDQLLASKAMPYPEPTYYPGQWPVINGQQWEHGAGRVCFDRTIDPDFFKQQVPTP